MGEGKDETKPDASVSEVTEAQPEEEEETPAVESITATDGSSITAKLPLPTVETKTSAHANEEKQEENEKVKKTEDKVEKMATKMEVSEAIKENGHALKEVKEEKANAFKSLQAMQQPKEERMKELVAKLKEQTLSPFHKSCACSKDKDQMNEKCVKCEKRDKCPKCP